MASFDFERANSNAFSATLSLLLIIANLLDHVEPTSAAELRRTLTLVLEPELLIVRDHLLVRDQGSFVSNILLGQAVEVSLHESRAETFVLKLWQNSKRVDGNCAALLLVSQRRVGRVVGRDCHVVVAHGAAIGLGGDDVAQQDRLAVRSATVDRSGGGVCRDRRRLRGGEDAKRQFGAFPQAVLELGGGYVRFLGFLFDAAVKKLRCVHALYG